MIKKIMLRKIAVASSILFVMLLLYLIPSNKETNNINNNQVLEYVYPNDLETIYLLNNYNYLSQTSVSIVSKDVLSKASDLIEWLTKESSKENLIPNGFSQLLPKGTKINNISLDNKILTIDFSKEFYNITKDNEKHVIEALIYTLTSLDGIDKIVIMVNGIKLKELPLNKEILPEYLDKNYGINKIYDITNLSDIDSYTVYYVFNYNDESYYTPVTKYIDNNNQDKVKIIIDELTSSFIFESNLMSYLDSNVKLLDYEIDENSIKLNFNDVILSDITNDKLLEEVIYTVGLSLTNELDISKVIFLVNNHEVGVFQLDE